MNKNLYQIETEYMELMNTLEDNSGEITPEIEEALIINEKELNQKSISYLAVVKNKESFNTLIDDEIKRLQQLKKQNSTIISKLKDNLLQAVNLFGAFEVGFNKFGTRKSSSVEVEDVNELPKEYKVVKVTEQADKAAIKKALQNGEKIPGCKIVEKKNLKIN